MGSLEAMAKGSETRYYGDTQNLKIAQVGCVCVCLRVFFANTDLCSGWVCVSIKGSGTRYYGDTQNLKVVQVGYA